MATVRNYIPLEDEHRLIIFDILDTGWPIGLNPLAGIDLKKPGAKDQTLDQLGALQNEMLTNSGSRLILRTQEPDASTYAKLYAASGTTANDISGQDENEHQYAVLRCDGERTGLFSMIVLPWPKPLPIPVEPYYGPDWQLLIPPDSPDPQADRDLAELIYQEHAQPANIVQVLADFTDADWQYTLDRWEAMRAYHRQYILDHPNCIALDESITDPDLEIQAAKRAAKQRLDRQLWLSRLLVATPRILAAAEYARIRRQIEPRDGMAQADRKSGKGRSKGEPAQPIVVQTTQGDVVVAATAQPELEPIVPIGFVTGATPTPGTVMAIPRIADDKTYEEVLQERGRRRGRDEIAGGFDHLSTPDDEE